MFFLSRKAKQQPVSGEYPESVRALFLKFRRIQKLNTRALEIMAEMDRVLGGEFIFDRNYMGSSIRELGEIVYHSVYCINAMAGNRYIRLYDRFQEIRDILDDILGGGMGPFAEKHALSYSDTGWELEPVVGSLNICLAEARYHLDLQAPDGFAVTAAGCRELLESARVGDRKSVFSGSEITGTVSVAAEAILKEFTLFSARNRQTREVLVRLVSLSESDHEFHEISVVCPATPERVLAACLSLLSDYASKNGDFEIHEANVALAVHEYIKSEISGTVRVESSEGFPAGVIRINAFCAGDTADQEPCSETYIVRKIFPYDLIRSEIIPKKKGTGIFPAEKGLKLCSSGLQRGHALLKPEFVRILSENAARFWRMTGENHELAWIKGRDGIPVFVDVKNLDAVQENAVPETGAISENYEAMIIASGGDTVQSGAAAGIVRHVKEGDSPDSFPEGSVAVAKTASPRLFTILRKASAFITEIGSPAGHLATVARELRVPSVFGLEKAMAVLPEGIEVTVDASERTIYRGIVEAVIAMSGCSSGLMPGDEEYAALRRLLRWITPLGLTEPDPGDLSAKSCRTYHDIIHFAHECSVERLIGIQSSDAGNLRKCSSRIELDIPIDLFMIDLGGALSTGSSDSGRIRPEKITSEPLNAFLSGLCDRRVWLDSPVPLKISDIVSGMGRMPVSASGMPRYSGTNHVIAADCYMNLGLLLGYHYTIIDSYFGNAPGQNYIYFRFAGGFADENRRNLRAVFIRNVLEEMDFKVDIKADLVVARLKIAAPDEMKLKLARLGQLSAFTRQMDLMMADSVTAESIHDEFRRIDMP